MIDNIDYKKIKDKYKENNYFSKLEVNINIDIYDKDDSNHKEFELNKVYISSVDLDFNRENYIVINEKINLLDSKLREENHKKEWQLFYIYKELIQIFENLYNNPMNTNYYRGQSRNWKMKAGIIRDDVKDEFLEKFDSIYEDIAYQFPYIINYHKFNNDNTSEEFKKREIDMAYLQHYGMRTSLVDITENPYIALLFLTTSNSFKFATLDMFHIDIEKHSRENIFSKVKMLEKNKRIIAQKGAFFNFDKIVTIENDEIFKIPLVRIKLNYNLKNIENISAVIQDKETKIKLNKKKSKN